MFPAILGPLDDPHHIGGAKHQLQHSGDHARNSHCGTKIDRGCRVLDRGCEGRGHSRTDTAYKVGGSKELAGDVRLAEHGHSQRVHGEHGHEQVDPAQCQDNAHDNQADNRKAVAESPEDKGRDAVGRTADLHQLSKERTQHEQQEEISYVVSKACHICGSNPIIQIHPLCQQEKDRG